MHLGRRREEFSCCYFVLVQLDSVLGMRTNEPWLYVFHKEEIACRA
jgi:hypothetical protein